MTHLLHYLKAGIKDDNAAIFLNTTFQVDFFRLSSKGIKIYLLIINCLVKY